MLIKNYILFEELKNSNIILKSGRINTRWKAMLPREKYPSRFDLFKEIWNFDSPVCEICGNSTLHTFNNPNFINPENVFSKICSHVCNKKLKSNLLKAIRNDPIKNSIRAAKFSKSVAKINNAGEKISTAIAKKAAATKSSTYVNGKSKLEWQKIKTFNTKLKNGSIINPETLSEFHKYRRLVHKLSAKESLNLLKNFEKRGHFNNKGYHLDHIVSVFDGFRFRIPAETIASIVNLRFIPALENTKKSGKSEMFVGELFKKYFLFKHLQCKLNQISEHAI